MWFVFNTLLRLHKAGLLNLNSVSAIRAGQLRVLNSGSKQGCAFPGGKVRRSPALPGQVNLSACIPVFACQHDLRA
jgi:hypothetical protein